MQFDHIADEEFRNLTRNLPTYTKETSLDRDHAVELEKKVREISEVVSSLRGAQTEEHRGMRKVERDAMLLILQDLRNKGASDAFIHRNMYRIKERLHHILYGE